MKYLNMKFPAIILGGVLLNCLPLICAQSTNEQFVFLDDGSSSSSSLFSSYESTIVDTSSSPQQRQQRRPINIVVIGAGAGGASTAYHLRQFADINDLPINITIFERNGYIGGRSTTVNVYDDPAYPPVELGASIFVQVNRILTQAVEDFGLSTSAPSGAGDDDNDEIPGAVLSVWDGKEFVFVQEGRGCRWWDYAKLFWRYGLAPLKTMRLMRATVGKFLKMYDEPYFPFDSLTQVAQDVGLLAVTAATGEQFLTENAITGEFGREVIQASTRVNYAQNLRYIHGLEAMVCMAAENAMAVQGGNWRIFQEMIRASQATILLETRVTGLEKKRGQSDESSYEVKSETTSASTQETETMAKENSQTFDTVILAAPYQFANIAISPQNLIHQPDEIPYVKLHVTLFASPHLVSPTFFNLPIDKPAPRVILTTLRKDEDPQSGNHTQGTSHDFLSISLLRAAINPKSHEKEYIYKIFSAGPAKPSFLCHLLGGTQCPDENNDSDEVNMFQEKESNDLNPMISWIYRKVWYSYPYEFPRVTFEPTRLDSDDDNNNNNNDVEDDSNGSGRGRLWYTSGIESFISTMETSALMGKNIAKLIVDDALLQRQQRQQQNEQEYDNTPEIPTPFSSEELAFPASGFLPP